VAGWQWRLAGGWRADGDDQISAMSFFFQPPRREREEKEDELLRSYQAITGEQQEASSRQRLARCGWNLESALNDYFEKDFSSARKMKKNKISTTAEPPKKQQLLLVGLGRDVQTPWEDHDFPCQLRSLDGRGGPQVLPDCLCSPANKARLCKVRKPGVNQGRDFYGCPVRKCSFFEWADEAPSSERFTQLVWKQFPVPPFKLVGEAEGWTSKAVKQGGVGDCWFMAGVSVIAERADVMESLIKIGERNALSEEVQVQDATVRFFLEGRWRQVRVDLFFPCHPESKLKGRKIKEELAFAKSLRGVMWPAIVEKAFAKWHGSYANIAAGFVRESFLALTGAPTVAVYPDSAAFNSEDTWQKLLGWSRAQYPISCSTGYDPEQTRTYRQSGIVGTHAYSVLEVRELWGQQKGRQPTVKDVWGGKVSSSKNNNEQSLRVLLIRNPWGRKRCDWNGDLGEKSLAWTQALRQELGWGRGEGTFWMTYQDFFTYFTAIEVCMVERGWLHTSIDAFTRKSFLGCATCLQVRNASLEDTSVCVFLSQPDKRHRRNERFWYAPLSVLATRDSTGEVLGASLHGVEEYANPPVLRLSLPPGESATVYALSPCSPTAPLLATLVLYAPPGVEGSAAPVEEQDSILSSLHNALMDGSVDGNATPLNEQGEVLLILKRSRGSVWLMAVNASSENCAWLRVSMNHMQGCEISPLCRSREDNTFVLPPLTQALVGIVTSLADPDSASFQFLYRAELLVTGDSHVSSDNVLPVSAPKPILDAAVALSLACAGQKPENPLAKVFLYELEQA
jgi:hypothetical protein